MTPRYHLRFQIAPGPNVEKDARELAKFCQSHGVEEVVLFIAAEEFNNGLLSANEETLWFETVRDAKCILDGAGIVVSLNPWMTVLHTDRGRTFPPDRKFAPMVSPTGEVSTACASFADPDWRRYIADLYGRFAELGFRVLWVEDDFRFHNHAPLTWGGGFEPPVIERFAATIGRQVTRDEIVAAILQPGTPHPWRVPWMETWREIHLETARIIAEAVSARSPIASRLGLMSSHPSSHSIEGRDWNRLFDALSIAGEVVHRPHYAGYSEGVGRTRDWSFMMLDLQRNLRPATCEVAPEVENYPFTRWSKSDTQTWSEMALCLFYGSDALLLDLFPFTGNDATKEPQIGELLDRSRPALKWIGERFTNDMVTDGVGLVWKEDAQAHVRTAQGASMTELDADPFVGGNYLLPFGISVSMRRQRVNALMGSAVWALSDDEIRTILSGGVLIDGIALEILSTRGFGEFTGVSFAGWAERDASLYSIEEVVSAASGAEVGLLFNSNLIPRIARVEPLPGAEVWTQIITPTRDLFGAGMVAFTNALGGKVITFSTPRPADLVRSYQRQAIAQAAVRYVSGNRASPTIVSGGAYLMPLHLAKASRHAIIVYNGSPDPARPVVLDASVCHRTLQATLLAPLAEPLAVKEISVAEIGSEHGYVAQCDVPYHGYLVLEWDAE